MSGPETRFIRSVHQHLPPEHQFHREKMANPYRSGGGDSWYSGTARDLWIEWKWVDLPARPDTLIDLTRGKKPSLTVLQRDWITNRRREGRHVWLGVGCVKGGVFFLDGEGFGPWTNADFQASCLDRKVLAAAIYNFCHT